MNGKEMKQKLLEIFGQQIKINKEFEDYFDDLKDGMKEDFLKWCLDCKNDIALGSIPVKKKFRDLYIFFRKIGNSTRAILIKRKNDGFIELILTNHKYYDEKRLELGYKKSSHYGS